MIVMAINIYRVDHILNLGLCWILATSPHGCVQLLGRDRPVHVLVKHVERLLESLKLIWT